MHQERLLTVTAAGEVGTGILLLFLPEVALSLLIGVGAPANDSPLIGRVAGSALLAIGVICWLVRGNGGGPAQPAVLIGVLIYDGAVALLLVYAGTALKMTGIGLWPAVAIHTLLGIWCVACLRT